MPSQPNLFESVPTFDRQSLAAKIRTLAERKIFIGTSSWRYEGWLGQVYTPERISRAASSRRRNSTRKAYRSTQKRSRSSAATSRSTRFPRRPSGKSSSPARSQHLRWDLKIPEDFTTRFSNQSRYGPRAGHENPTFLDADAFQGAFLEPLAPYLDRVGVFLIEFGTFSKASCYAEPKAFFDDLNGFLRRLPRDLQYAVEIRNDDFLDAAYFDVLKANRVAHIFTSWSRMPSLRQQLLIEEAFTAPFTTARALLRPGRAYAQAVEVFSPYSEVKEEYPSARQALRDLIHCAREREISAYIHINNRLEGNAIQTIEGIVSRTDI